MFRAGDVVKHGPTGETWWLAVDEERGEVMPAGWPETIARASDCTIERAASDEQHISALREVSAGQGLRGSIARDQLSKLGLAAPAAGQEER
jgi:hypothetical protein